MKSSLQGVKVAIMGREFSVACLPHEEQDLIDAARYLDEKMQDIQRSGKIIGTERCAIMAALNITNDLIKERKTTDQSDEIATRLQSLQEKIDDAMGEPL
jgi:cell division protein ZapA